MRYLTRLTAFAVAIGWALDAFPSIATAQDTAQQLDVLDLDAFDESDAPRLSSETPDIGADTVPQPEPPEAEVTRAKIRSEIMAANAAGFLVPENADLSRYPVETLRELETILADQPDPCLKAVETALFLNARHPPSLLEYGGKLTLEGLPKEMAKIWVLPDEGDLMVAVSKGWTNLAVSGFDIVSKSVRSYDAFLDAHMRAVIDRQASWTQEMVHQAIRADYDGDALQHARGRLDLIIEKNTNWMDRIEDTADKERAAAEKAFDEAIKDAKDLQAYALRKHEEKYGRLWHGVSAAVIAYNRIIATFKEAEKQAVTRRHAAVKRAYTAREQMLTIAMERMAEARVKNMALDRYAAPISRGECEKINTSTGHEMPLQSVEDMVIDKIKTLPKDRFETLMNDLDVTVPSGFYGCLCAAMAQGGVGGGWTIKEGTCYAVGVLGGLSEVDMSKGDSSAAWAGCLDRVRIPSADNPDGVRMQDVLIDRLREMPGKKIAGKG